MKFDYCERIAVFRSRLFEAGIDAFLVADADTVGSEIPAEHWRCRTWLCGFDGSYGTLVVLTGAVRGGVSASEAKQQPSTPGAPGAPGAITASEAKPSALWTDGRYWLQAEAQLAEAGAGVALMREGLDGVPSPIDWVCRALSPGATIGVDGRVTMVDVWRELAEKAGRAGLRVRTDFDPFAGLWTVEGESEGGRAPRGDAPPPEQGAIRRWCDRPPLPAGGFWELPLEYAGESAESKRARVLAEAAKAGTDSALICSPDAVAWLTNTRGSDIPYAPVACRTQLVTADDAGAARRAPAAPAGASGPSGAAAAAADRTPAAGGAPAPGPRLLYDPRVTSVATYQALPADVVPVEGAEPTWRLKAVKNHAELANLRRAMEADGRTLVRFLMWLEASVGAPAIASAPPVIASEAKQSITETDAAAKLAALRAADPCCIGESFAPICAYGQNAAIVHYHAVRGREAALEPHGLFVVDTGGHYYGRDPGTGLPVCGTTDITRTIALTRRAGDAGALTPEARRDFTLVLKAHIAFATLRFRHGATGAHLDALARRPLWDRGMDYAHGTGHGVGYLLNVHESPPSVSGSPDASIDEKARVEADMVLSNEPGLYCEGKYGIRIENLVRPYVDESNEFGTFLRFETLSLCPISRDAIDAFLLTDEETQWLDAYHAEVYARLSPGLTEPERAWLRAATAPISTG